MIRFDRFDSPRATWLVRGEATERSEINASSVTPHRPGKEGAVGYPARRFFYEWHVDDFGSIPVAHYTLSSVADRLVKDWDLGAYKRSHQARFQAIPQRIEPDR